MRSCDPVVAIEGISVKNIFYKNSVNGGYLTVLEVSLFLFSYFVTESLIVWHFYSFVVTTLPYCIWLILRALYRVFVPN